MKLPGHPHVSHAMAQSSTKPQSTPAMQKWDWPTLHLFPLPEVLMSKSTAQVETKISRKNVAWIAMGMWCRRSWSSEGESADFTSAPPPPWGSHFKMSRTDCQVYPSPLRMSCNNCGDPLCTFTLCSVLISRCYLHCGDHEAVDGKWTGPLLSDSTSVGFARPFLTAAELDGFVQVRVWYLGYLHRKNICVRTVTAAKKSVGSEIFIKQRFISPP